MDRKASIVVATATAAVVLGGAGFFAFRDSTPHRSEANTRSAVAAIPPAGGPETSAWPLASRRARSAVSATTPAAGDGLFLDETALMDTLRELRRSDPNLTLQLAREGNQRFKDSPDTAERSWCIVKALSDLGRHDEARVEGRALVDRYRETRWAQDVYRHLFVNPPTHPFERGYGKKLESDP